LNKKSFLWSDIFTQEVPNDFPLLEKNVYKAVTTMWRIRWEICFAVQITKFQWQKMCKRQKTLRDLTIT